MASLKRWRPGGALARTVAGPIRATMRVIDRMTMAAALRRPDGTRNSTPSYQDDVVSTPSGAGRSVGQAMGVIALALGVAQDTGRMPPRQGVRSAVEAPQERGDPVERVV